MLWPVALAQVLPCPQLIFPSKTWVFWNLFEFSAAKITLKNQYLPHSSESRSYQINSIKNPAHQDLSNDTKGTFQFQLQFSSIFSEEIIIQYSRAIQRHQEQHDVKHHRKWIS
jgi:hypothetical protein